MGGGVESIRDGFGVDVEPLVGFGGGVVGFWATLVFEGVIVAFLKRKKKVGGGEGSQYEHVFVVCVWF